MITARTRRRILQVSWPVLAAAGVAYFAYYTVEGGHGLLALMRLQAQAGRSEDAFATVKAEHDAIQLKVMSLRPESLDRDRLDERTRALLNDSRSDELIINLPGRSDSGH
jgi:cell division protein FtsB